MNDVKVFDCPKFLSESLNILTQCITILRNEGDDYNIAVPISLKSATSYFRIINSTVLEYGIIERNG